MKTLGKAMAGTALVILMAVLIISTAYYSGGLYNLTQNPMYLPPNMKGSVTQNCDWTTQHWDPNTSTCVANTAVSSGQGGPAPLIVGETDALGGPLKVPYQGAVEVISSDKASQLDNITIKQTFNIGTTPIVPGTSVLLHAWYANDLSGYYDYTDEWYSVTVGQNAIVSHLVPSATGDPTKENFGVMTWYSTGAAVGWMITPAFSLLRDDALGNGVTAVQLAGPGVTVDRTANFTTAAGGNPDSSIEDFTASGTSFTLKVTISNGETATDLGHPFITIGPNLEWQSRFMVAWISFNSTTISPDPLIYQGWTPVGSAGQATGYASYYKALPEIKGTRTDAGTGGFDIKVDTSLAGSGAPISVRVWVATGQLLSTVKVGLSTTAGLAPVALYGGVTKYSEYVTGFNYGLSSGKPTGQVVYAVFITK